jgi:hypothetical protein
MDGGRWEGSPHPPAPSPCAEKGSSVRGGVRMGGGALWQRGGRASARHYVGRLDGVRVARAACAAMPWIIAVPARGKGAGG